MRWPWGRRTNDPPTVRMPGGDPPSAQVVHRAVHDHLPGEVAAHVFAQARPSLRMLHADGATPVGHLGGPARMDGRPWPTWQDRPLSVVAGLDLAAVARHGDPVGGLPSAGWLTFFSDAQEQSTWGFDPGDLGSWRVVHALTSSTTSAPGGLVLPEVPLRAVPEMSLPDGEEPVLSGLRAAEADAYADLRARLVPADVPVHRLGGWPELVQGELWLTAQLASSGVYVGSPEGFRDPRVPALRPGAADWRLLLQLDSDWRAQTMWGDTGRLYFTARQQDLARGAVEDGWFELQC